jgi:hypothetical protein
MMSYPGKFGEVCRHGSLMRSCETCEIESDRDALAKEVERLKALIISDNKRFVETAEEVNLEIGRLKAELEERSNITFIIKLQADRDRWRTLAGKIAEALKAQRQMRDMNKPRKLDEAISWRDNDDLAEKLTAEALALYAEAGKP